MVLIAGRLQSTLISTHGFGASVTATRMSATSTSILPSGVPVGDCIVIFCYCCVVTKKEKKFLNDCHSMF